MKRFKTVLLATLCCAFVGVYLTGCSKPQPVTETAKGLSDAARKDKKGDE